MPDENNQSLVSHQKVLRIFRPSNFLKNFLANLMVAYFTLDELTQANVNVTSRRPKDMTDPVNGLDNNRLEIIRLTVSGYMNGSVEEKMTTWRKCKNAMCKKMSDLKKNSRLFLNNQ